MYDKLLEFSGIIASIFAVVSMSVMLLFASSQEIVFSQDEKLEDAPIVTERNLAIEGNKERLAISKIEEGIADFSIPLKEEILYEDIVIENDYLDEVLYLKIIGLEENYFEDNPIYGSEKYVTNVYCQFYNGVTNIELQLSDIYEYSVVLKNNKLLLEFMEPKSVHEKIVVIDITEKNSHNGDNIGIDSLFNDKILEKIEKLLDEHEIYGYYFGKNNVQVDEATKARIASKVNADMIISIYTQNKNVEGLLLEEEKLGVKSIYNSTYFIPLFSSIQLSNLIERNTAQATNLYAIGLEEAEAEDTLIIESSLPATRIEIYYENQEKERNSLAIETLSEEIASGIVNGIVEAYEYIQ